MTQRIARLPARAQYALTLAACIGSRFDLRTLAVASEQSEQATGNDLDLALAEGLVTRLATAREDEPDSAPCFAFVHDRVQQSAHALIPQSRRAFVHLTVGRLLRAHAAAQQLDAEMFNIAQANRAWVDRRCRPQALATFECPALLTGAHASVPKKHYILADGWDPSPFRHFASQVDGKAGWALTKMACGHDIMVDMPKELAEVLAAMA